MPSRNAPAYLLIVLISSGCSHHAHFHDKIAKVEIGMVKHEVYRLLGEPTAKIHGERPKTEGLPLSSSSPPDEIYGVTNKYYAIWEYSPTGKSQYSDPLLAVSGPKKNYSFIVCFDNNWIVNYIRMPIHEK